MTAANSTPQITDQYGYSMVVSGAIIFESIRLTDDRRKSEIKACDLRRLRQPQPIQEVDTVLWPTICEAPTTLNLLKFMRLAAVKWECERF